MKIDRQVLDPFQGDPTRQWPRIIWKTLEVEIEVRDFESHGLLVWPPLNERDRAVMEVSESGQQLPEVRHVFGILLVP